MYRLVRRVSAAGHLPAIAPIFRIIVPGAHQECIEEKAGKHDMTALIYVSLVLRTLMITYVIH